MIPFTILELEIVIRQHKMDIYHKALMIWAAKRIRYLEEELARREKNDTEEISTHPQV